MSWIYENITTPSEIEGTIRAERRFGEWSVRYDRAIQTNRYTNAMWAYSCTKVPGNAKNILLLGLGGGGAVKKLYQHFPGSHITAVEYDSAMIAIAKRLRLSKPYPLPQIIHGEADTILAQLPGPFDLIIVDLFDQAGLSPLLTQPAFLRDLGQKVGDTGQVLINFALFPNRASNVTSMFYKAELFRFRANILGLFSNKKT